MQAARLTPAQLEAAGIGAFFRPRDLEALEIPYAELQRLVTEGAVEKVGPGLYRLAAAEPSEFETLAMVASAVPGAILCLLSALALHGIGTQAPHEVWLGLDRKARKPSRLPARARIVRFSGPMLSYGIETRVILGVPVRVTSPARTIVDCFRYRNKIGLDVALEGLLGGTLFMTVGAIVPAGAQTPPSSSPPQAPQVDQVPGKTPQERCYYRYMTAHGYHHVGPKAQAACPDPNQEQPNN